MTAVSLFLNWCEWCLRFRTIVPWNCRFVAQRRHTRLTPELEAVARKLAEELR